MGYISKHEPAARVVAALRLVLQGERYITPGLSKSVLGFALQPGSAAVTPEQILADRELEVFELLGKGIGTREIAQRLGRSVKTIEAYRARIKRKLHLQDAPTLMREAVRWIETRAN
jgi:DNA-binding NarL/FixJ family response regulator